MNLETTNHLDNIRKAAKNLDGVLRKTELIYSDFSVRRLATEFILSRKTCREQVPLKFAAHITKSQI